MLKRMAQISIEFLSDIISILLGTLSLILTILVALFGYFLSKFNNLIDSVDTISNELESLNDTNERIEDDIDEVSTAIVRIEERTRGDSNMSSDGSGFSLLHETENEKPYQLNIFITSPSQEIFGEDYESLIEDVAEPIDTETLQIHVQSDNRGIFEVNEDIFSTPVQTGIWIVSPEVLINNRTKMILYSQRLPQHVQVLVPLESEYWREDTQDIVRGLDGYFVSSKESLITAIHAYARSLKFGSDADDIWKAEMSEGDDLTKE